MLHFCLYYCSYLLSLRQVFLVCDNFDTWCTGVHWQVNGLELHWMKRRERTTELFRENATSLVKRTTESLCASLRSVTDSFSGYWTVCMMLDCHCLRFLHATSATAVAHLSHRNSVRPFVHLSVCPSVCHAGGSVKSGASYDHQIFTVGCMEDSSFRNFKAFPWIRRGSPQTRAINERG